MTKPKPKLAAPPRPTTKLSAREMMVVAATLVHGKQGATIAQMVPVCVVFEHWAKLDAVTRKRSLAVLASSKWVKRFQEGGRA